MFIILMTEDSTIVDSARVYEIPEILHFGFQSEIGEGLYSTQNIVPTDYDVNLLDAFSHSPFTVVNFGPGQLNLLSQKGQDPQHVAVHLNNHRIENRLFGYMDLAAFPIQFIDTISVEQDYYGKSGIDLTTKINHYHRPFSQIKYTTGAFETDMYNVDFTRSITNNFGIYISGLYWSSQGHRRNSDFGIGSFYAHINYNQIIPMRFDALYFSNDFGVPGDDFDTLDGSGTDRFIDVCYAVGTDNHRLALYYTSNSKSYDESLSDSLFQTAFKNYGLDFRTCYDIKGYEILWNLLGVRNTIESAYDLDFVPDNISQSENSLRFGIVCNKAFQNVLFSVSNVGEFRNDDDFFYTPRVCLGFKLLESTYLMGAVSKNYRVPSVAEIYFPERIKNSYIYIKGNEKLLPEYSWSQEIGIKGDFFAFTFYKNDYDDLIVLRPDSNDYYYHQNIDTWQTIGVENSLEIPMRLNNRLSKSVTEVCTGFSGNYLFKGEALPLIPEGNANVFVTFRRNAERFGLGLTVQGQFIGNRQDIYGQGMAPFKVVSLVGAVRFVTLSFILRLDNVFNEEYVFVPHYTMEPRHINFSVKWEFWD